MKSNWLSTRKYFKKLGNWEYKRKEKKRKEIIIIITTKEENRN
jgi:hypothetical protein